MDIEELIEKLTQHDGIWCSVPTGENLIADASTALSTLQDENAEMQKQLNEFSEFLCHMTGGMLSKTNYTAQEMISAADDYTQKVCGEYDLRAENIRWGQVASAQNKQLDELQAENENLRAESEEAIKLIKEREVFHKKTLETADKAIVQSIEFLDDMKRMKQDLDEAVAELEQVKNERDSARATLHYLQLYGLKEI